MAGSTITIPSGEQMGYLIGIVQDFVRASDRLSRRMLCLTTVVTLATIANTGATILMVILMIRH